MNLLESLRQDIANALAQEKAHTLAAVCEEVGLSAGNDTEAWKSKYYYAHRRLTPLSRTALIAVGKQVLERYPSYQLEEALDLLSSRGEGVISAITRRNIIDDLNSMGNLEGNLHLAEFLGRSFPLTQMPGPAGDLYKRTMEDCVYQHMIRNEDWSYKDFFESVHFIQLSERRFRLIVEQVVHPEVRTGAEQERFITAINPHLLKDGFELLAVDQTSGYLVYRIVRKGGVAGLGKNLIFAANGPKPKLVLADAVNNDIRIVENQEYCLVYDRPIGPEGLRWKELVDWWADRAKPAEDPEKNLYKRLAASLASEPEKRFFRYYFECLRSDLSEQLPAIIPQVYLHYDPYTLRELPNGSALARQRMDFLLLFPYCQRVVIEIDGQQHYFEGERASPRLYAMMVAEDRNLRLQGYEVYRFGGFELMGDKAEAIVHGFLTRLIKKAS
jgi:hypothetical protein